MPEGDVIYRYAAILADFFSNTRITAIRVLSGRYLKKPIQHLDKVGFPITVTDIGTKGKFMFLELSNGWYVFITHGMSGTWVHEGLGAETRYDHFDTKHNRIEFVTPKGSLFYNDYRNFGTFQIMTDKASLDDKLAELGPDILDDTITMEQFFGRMKPNKKIAELLMDQKVVSGIGNYLRAEILWYARISPHRLYKTFTQDEKQRLFYAAYNLIRYHTIKKKSKKYPSMNPTKLDYHLNITPSIDFFVYRQEKDYYGNDVVSEKLGDRTIHWVPAIQK